MSSPSARFSSSSRSMRSIKDFSCAPAIPPTSGIIPSPPVVMLPPQQGRDDSLRAWLAQGREANVPKPINAWGTNERARLQPAMSTALAVFGDSGFHPRLFRDAGAGIGENGDVAGGGIVVFGSLSSPRRQSARASRSPTPKPGNAKGKPRRGKAGVSRRTIDMGGF